jgi:predicted AlkP superfamily pyrophosphatase or phosphodiesterase
MITGVRADEHGILENRRPKSEGGEYYWSSSLLKVKTLWHAAAAAGLKTAAITWPVTADAPITFNLPEFFRRRNGGGMDLASIEEKGTPGLVAKIANEYPSFPHQWMDDRARALATIYLLKRERPSLILVHFVDHDAEAHDRGPFTREANAMIEYTDELIGRILEAAPKDLVVALVSDHGFERVDKLIPVPPGIAVAAGLALAPDAEAAGKLRPLAGREVPMDEVSQYAPHLAKGHVAAFEPPEHAAFTEGKEAAPQGRGEHGFWPTRPDYRSVFILWGQGVKARRTPPMSMLDIAPRLAQVLGVNLQ